MTGRLWVVATPIGNLEDISPRAVRVLGEVDLIAAEDTRHSGRLLLHLGVDRPLVSLHDHNEEARCEELVRRMGDGISIALIADAGTPLISDPGYRLVRAARAAGIVVQAVPGPSAVLAALSVAGLPTDRFRFEGFLPASGSSRRRRLEQIASYAETCVLFEATHRIARTLQELASHCGGTRLAVVCRELTKRFEESHDGSLDELAAHYAASDAERRGEFAIVLAAAPASKEDEVDPHLDRWLSALLEEMSPSRAARLAARVTGLDKQQIYRRLTPSADTNPEQCGAGR